MAARREELGESEAKAVNQQIANVVKNGVDAKTHYSIAIHKQAGYPWGKDARINGSLYYGKDPGDTASVSSEWPRSVA